MARGVTLAPVTCDHSDHPKCHAEGDANLTTNNRDEHERIQAVMPTATSTLQASLEKHNETFETLLSLIPAKYYLVRDDNNDQVGFHCLAVRAYIPTELPQGTSKYHKNKKGQQAPKQAIKEASKKARREKVRSSI